MKNTGLSRTKAQIYLDYTQKRYLAIFMVLFIGFPHLKSQNVEEDALYWHHRGRLFGDGTEDNPGFVKRCAEPGLASSWGCMIPAERSARHIHCGKNWFFGNWQDKCFNDSKENGGMNWSDATVHLGFYIGVLATEYQLLSQNREIEKSETTLKELYDALEAYERLDRFAETLWGLPGKLDGFFARDDVPQGYTMELDAQGKPNFPGIHCLTSGNSCHYWRMVPDTSFIPTKKRTKQYQIQDLVANRPTADQLFGLLLGLSLVKECVPESAIVNEESVNYKARNIVHLLVSHLRANPKWQWRFPDGAKPNDLHRNFQWSYLLAETANWITKNEDGSTPPAFLSSYHNGFSLSVGMGSWGIITGLHPVLFNEVVVSEVGIIGSVSGKLTPLFQNLHARKFKIPLFALLRELLHGNGKISLKRFPKQLNLAYKQNFRYAEYLLSVAPKDKFCNGPKEKSDRSRKVIYKCDCHPEWATWNRWEHYEQIHSLEDQDAAYNGLDYLLLFNVVQLLKKREGELGEVKKMKKKSPKRIQRH